MLSLVDKIDGLKMDDEIVDVMTREEEEEEGEAATTVHTVGRDMAVDAFTTSIKWAEENGVSACEILVYYFN